MVIYYYLNFFVWTLCICVHKPKNTCGEHRHEQNQWWIPDIVYYIGNSDLILSQIKCLYCSSWQWLRHCIFKSPGKCIEAEFKYARSNVLKVCPLHWCWSGSCCVQVASLPLSMGAGLNAKGGQSRCLVVCSAGTFWVWIATLLYNWALCMQVEYAA